MADFKVFLPILLQNEGFYSNNPADSGGETWRGISRNNYPKWAGWVIVDSYRQNENFPHILRADTNLADLVEKFYKQTQWDLIRADEIDNQSIANFLADWGVNAGMTVPVKHAQQILGIPADGRVGPQTLESLNAAPGAALFRQLQAAREQFYRDVVAQHPKDNEFLSNWLERNASFKYTA